MQKITATVTTIINSANYYKQTLLGIIISLSAFVAAWQAVQETIPCSHVLSYLSFHNYYKFLSLAAGELVVVAVSVAVADWGSKRNPVRATHCMQADFLYCRPFFLVRWPTALCVGLL